MPALRNGILHDPYTQPLMAFDSAIPNDRNRKVAKVLGEFVKDKLSPADYRKLRTLAQDTSDSPHLRVPGDLSDAWELRVNPSYAKTLRDNGTQTRAPLPAEDDDTMTDERIQKMAKALKEQLRPDELAALIAAIDASSGDEDAPATDEDDPSTNANTNAKRNALGIDAALRRDLRTGSRFESRFPTAKRIGTTPGKAW